MDVVTWSVLELDEPAATCPWTAPGAVFATAGMTAAGRAGMPSGCGRWWSVLARHTDPRAADAAEAALDPALGRAWHVRLEPVAYRGDVVHDGGRTPFDDLPGTGSVRGAAAVITFAGLGPDPVKLGEFLDRFGALADDLAGAEGALASAVLTPAAGPVLTFSAWTGLPAAMAWAYAGPVHSATIARQEQAQLVETAGFLRCRLVASSGSLLGGDPLRGLVAA